jgi:hypothetical protein
MYTYFFLNKISVFNNINNMINIIINVYVHI